MKNLILAIPGLLVLSTTGFSNIIYVPNDHSTIQDAINAAVDGDEIIVRPGTYVERIDFIGKSIRLCSERGPTVTIISAPQGPYDGGDVVRFASGEGAGSVLKGFTVTGGHAGHRGFGSGIGCQDSSPTIIGNIITGNSPSGHFGGAGGGICCYSSSAIIENNTIAENVASDGGGILCVNSSPTISNNLISDNYGSSGGGIFCWGDGITRIDGNTISENVADNGGGIALCQSGAFVTNTILWANSGGSGAEVCFFDGASTLSIEFSDLGGGLSSIHLEPGCTLHWGPGMIDTDPLFVDAASGDYRLQQHPCQPGVVNLCVDAGDPLSPMVTGTTRTDVAQDGGGVDMGFHYDIASIPGVPYCYGDPGSGTPCPCANDNDGTVPGSGCANGAHTQGARLIGSGIASVSNDTLTLTAVRLDPNNTGLYFQADNAVNGGDGNPFGDGLRCAGGGLIRLQIQTSDADGMSSTAVAIGAKGGVSPGDTKRYQCWYRDTSGNQPCGVGVNDFNLSNGYEITWLP